MNNYPSAYEIRREYDEACSQPNDWEKSKWASEVNMLNRFKLAMDLLPFAQAASWLDIGCGSGVFQKLVLEKYPVIKSLGIDLSPQMISCARGKNIDGVQFSALDFREFNGGGFDLATCIGVLQRTNQNTDDFFKKLRQVLSVGGYFFVDTKNLGWSKFATKELEPESHLIWHKLEDLKQLAKDNGLSVIKSGGFDPSRGKVVAPGQSSTIFLLGQLPEDLNDN